jgi:probable F420-dependent oxidoreductase
VKVGVNILNFGPGADPDNLLAWARLSEELGYHSIWISDHIAITSYTRPRYPEPFFDMFTTLAWLAGQTQRIQLGTTVCVLPFRHAVHTARLVANLDVLSKGRFIFGVGISNAAPEFAVLGQPFEKRGALSNEILRALQALWTGVGPVSFKGRHLQFEDVDAMATWQKPYPPVWVGGMSEAALKRTVRFGEAWHPLLLRSMDIVSPSLATLRQLADEAGKPAPRFCPRIRLDIQDAPLGPDRVPGTGSYDQVTADIRELASLGAEHLVLDWFTGDPEATRDNARGRRMLEMLADRCFDLKNESFR